MKLTRQHVFLGILLALVGYVVLPYLRSSDSTQSRGAAATQTAGDFDIPPELDLSIRAARRPEFNPSGGRNLFAYGRPPRPMIPPPPKTKRPKPPPTKLPIQTAAAGGPSTQGVTPPPPPVATAPAGPTPPPVNFKYIGYMGPSDHRIAVFTIRTDDGSEIALARVGEAPRVGSSGDLEDIQKRLDEFRVVNIGYEEVEIGYADDVFADQTKTLMMGGRS
ncbi:MAG: hypothetical protein ACE5IK_09325 [Acidobacteriota bacterium]